MFFIGGIRMMNLRGFDLNLLVIFKDLYSSRSVSQSALNLNMSQPAVSHALARLRVTLEDELFIRSQRTYVPTEKAVMLGEYLDHNLKELEGKLFNTQQWDEKESTKIFTLSGTSYDAQVWFPNLMCDLKASAPGIKVNFKGINLEKYLTRMISGEVDLSFAGNLSGFKGFEVQTLGEWGFSIIANKASRKYKNKITMSEYLKADHILYTPTEKEGSDIDDFLADKGKQRNIAIQTSYLSSIPDLVVKRDYLSIVPSFFAKSIKEYFPVKVLETPFKVPDFKHQMIWHKSRDNSIEHKWLRTYIRNNYNDLMK
jgi:DNA-binding transcriptional LysR family regulator